MTDMSSILAKNETAMNGYEEGDATDASFLRTPVQLK